MPFFCCTPPRSLLRHLTAGELLTLSGHLAAAHQAYIASADATHLTAHAAATHAYDVSLRKTKYSEESKLARLACPLFWRAKVNAVADSARETYAAQNGHLGAVEIGAEPYCTKASIDIFLDRQAKRFRKDERSISRFLSVSANSAYMSAIGLAEQAYDRGHASVLLTLTLPPKYHPSSASYEGYSLPEAHECLSSMLSKLIAVLSKKAVNGEDFCGIRAAEVSVDGCPHWHVIIYVKQDLIPLIHSTLAKLMKLLSCESERHFLNFEDKIVNVRLPTCRIQYKQAISYIFKSSYAGRNGSQISVMDGLRQRIALSAHGKTQYQFIGSKGRVSKYKQLRQFVKKQPNLKGISGNLVVQRSCKDRRSKQMSSVIALFAGGHKNYKIVKKATQNRYGDEVMKAVAATHAVAAVSEDLQVGQEVKYWDGIRSNYSSYSRCETGAAYDLRKPLIHHCTYIRGPPTITDNMFFERLLFFQLIGKV